MEEEIREFQSLFRRRSHMWTMSRRASALVMTLAALAVCIPLASLTRLVPVASAQQYYPDWMCAPSWTPARLRGVWRAIPVQVQSKRL